MYVLEYVRVPKLTREVTSPYPVDTKISVRQINRFCNLSISFYQGAEYLH